MTVNWYDVLDVPPDAGADEIRDAWKSAVADLDPTDRSFRVFNQAAEVLLDPKKRAAYDAELAASEAAEAEADDGEEAEDEAEEPTRPVLTKSSTDTDTAEAEEEAEDAEAEDDEAVPAGVAVRSALASWVPPAWLLAGLAVLTALVVSAAAWLWFAVPSDGAISDATSEAQAAAERAAVPVLSYDYTRLDADQESAHRFMTSDYRSDYDKLFTLVEQNAPKSETKVKASVVASSVVRSGAERVEILLFVDQATTNKATPEPKIFRNQATLTMEKVDGEWLVDAIKTQRLDE